MPIDPQTRVYTGMIAGQHARDNDFIVNVRRCAPTAVQRS